MKNSIILILFCAVVSLAAVLIWWHREKQMLSINSSPITHEANTNVQPINLPPNQTGLKTEGTNLSLQSILSMQTSSNTPAQKRAERLQRLLEGKNVPVNFYGKVIDQDSNSLSGVEIKVTVRHWGLTLKDISTEIPIERTTDESGRFKLDGATGDAFDLDYIRKTGYEVEPGQRSFGAACDSYDEPIVFKMWSTNIDEQLITGEKRFHVAIDGRPYFISLTDGTISQSDQGDLKVWIKFPAETNAEQPNNWLAEIDAVNGGILEEHDPYSSMYLAPESSYTQTFQIARQLVRKNQRGMTGQHRFYIALKNGKEYGRVSVELFAPYNNEIPGLIDIQYAVNPSGSRILR